MLSNFSQACSSERPRTRGAAAVGVGAALTLVGATLALLPMQAAQATTGPITVQVSVTTGGQAPDNGSNGLGGASGRFSSDGRYVVFASSGPVVPGQQQLSWQIMRRDRQLGTTELISKSTAGAMGNGNSYEPSVSADGQVIAFRSAASNLVADDTNDSSDIFVHDVRTGVTTRASVDSSGGQVPASIGAGNPVAAPSISADGRWVGFTSTVGGYTVDDGPGAHAYLHDRQTGAIEVVSRSDAGHVRNGHEGTAVTVSGNGDFVTFQSLHDNHAIQVFVRDRRAGQETTEVIGGEEWRDLRQSMTPDGRFVVYDTDDADQVDDDTNDQADVFVFDRQAGTRERVSVASDGTQGNGGSTHASISDDGRYVSFLSHATNLVAGDTNGEADVFRHDRSTGETIRVNLSEAGDQTDAATRNPAISGDGQHISFDSHARLTPVETGTWQQVYVRDLEGRFKALFAAIGKTPKRVVAKQTYRVTTRDIKAGPALRITWTPQGKGKAVNQTAGVQNNAFTLRAPGKRGKYTVTVAYAGRTLATRTINVPKPSAKKLTKTVKKGTRLKVTTVGVKAGQKVKVRWQPRGAGASTVTRSAKVNQKGVAKVRSAPRTGAYRVTVRHQGKVLRTGVVNVR